MCKLGLSINYMELDASASPIIKFGIKNRLICIAMKGRRRLSF
jgi:hypothetical protein